MTGTKAMRAALPLRQFRYWDTEVLHDEGTVRMVLTDHPAPLALQRVLDSLRHSS